MNYRRTSIQLSAIALLLTAGLAQAQATRTWVSGVGDDANPCSRTAPCKTFAGAISKTAAAGEINVLDPGGFGGVTITKSITIVSEGFEAGVLVSGTNGIIVNAAASDVVVLRGLDIEGLGTGLDGIRILSAGAVFVEKCTINNFTQNGINLAPSVAGTFSLFVSDSVIRRNGSGAGTVYGGIQVQPAGSAGARVSVDRTRLERNYFGIRIMNNVTATISESIATGNSAPGFLVLAGWGHSELTLESCVASYNGGPGVKAEGAAATARLSNLTTIGNASGIASASGGTVTTFGNNRNDGNTTNGAPNAGPIALQ